ncbi:hypothetical protein QFC22_005920 [Naganishia vaughanmartiniae]|uniref:Uncharacterized protein n=1 Tax=Naganishia vaughanmartiniae TaxID=1424756 RepID=A0ACC2WSV5_9TREE|nr:hypothetical protein QFC22_005920 [Naganishia vaughanmartiniae]
MPTIPSILSGSLPPPGGPYSVGYYTVTHAPLGKQGFVLSSPTIDTRKPANKAVYGSHTAPPFQRGDGEEEGAGSRGWNGWEEGHVPALGLRRVEYSVYYPCETPKGWFGRDAAPGGVGWLPSPVSDVLLGYSRFMNDSSWLRAAFPVLKVLGGRLTIPVYPLAKPLETVQPPATTPTGASGTSMPPPLVIFSHGLAGTHLTYSHVCSALASRGYVVLSISHQDGSGPVASIPQSTGGSGGLWAQQGGVVRARKEDGAFAGKDGKGKGVGEVLRTAGTGQKGDDAVGGGGDFKLSYLRYNELDWSPDPQPDVMTLRSLQLDIRVHELYATYRSFHTLVTQGASALSSAGLTISAGSNTLASNEATEWLDTNLGAGKVNTTSVDLVGHSFGGGTLLWALERDVPEGEQKLPVRKAVALDPWVDPLPMPAPMKGEKDKPEVPIFVINSSRFTLWSTHFNRLKRLINQSHGTLVTLLGAGHETFSDFPFLWQPRSAHTLLTTVDELVYAFLRGEVKEHDKVRGKEADRGVVRTSTVDKKGKDMGKQQMEGEWGDVVVHELGRE